MNAAAISKAPEIEKLFGNSFIDSNVAFIEYSEKAGKKIPTKSFCFNFEESWHVEIEALHEYYQ